MKVFLDTADLEEIRALYDIYPLDGVTTNPTILAAEKKAPYETLTEIRSFLGQEGVLHVQVISRNAEDMIEEAYQICNRLGSKTYVKIPVVPDGLKAIRFLAKNGMRVTATGIYTLQQAFWAGKSGAAYVAPYVNRIENLGADGIQTVCDIQNCFVRNGIATGILAASFKNIRQVMALAENGVASVTVAPAILRGMLENASVDLAVDRFINDFENAFGVSATMSTIAAVLEGE